MFATPYEAAEARDSLLREAAQFLNLRKRQKINAGLR
jgi:hypothetical protein